MSEPTVNLRNPPLAAFLAWLVPGLGHFYQGRIGKGTLYAICILSLYLMGMVMGEGKIVFWRWVNPLNNPEKFQLYYLGQFFVGLPTLPAVVQGTLHHFGWDPILWGFMAEPAQNDLNALQTRLGKLVEIGSIYTCIAGLLNILAIYDAYEGPAYQEYEEDAVARSAAGPVPTTSGIGAEGTA
jgi:TM2 domain-containing membrane protein YozV